MSQLVGDVHGGREVVRRVVGDRGNVLRAAGVHRDGQRRCLDCAQRDGGDVRRQAGLRRRFRGEDRKRRHGDRESAESTHSGGT